MMIENDDTDDDDNDHLWILRGTCRDFRHQRDRML